MCGICGALGYRRSGEVSESTISRMNDTLTHRGPDDSGIWVDFQSAVMLGHRRLAILDVSPAGHQPMTSSNDRYVLTYNGEIYNHLQLRTRLEYQKQAPTWRGHSDTETLLACFSAWGVTATLRAARGMFALALWDKNDRTLTLARDRVGEKPLYYGQQGELFLFGSELAALEAHPSFAGEIDRGALALLLRHNCVPAPYSIYQGIHKLSPGHFVNVRRDSLGSLVVEASQPYWSLSGTIAQGSDDPFTGSDSEAISVMEQCLSETIESHMMSDVPLGAFLSGGIDSSTIVALMQSFSDRPVQTFTIGSTTAAYDEAPHAAEVARHLGTDHTELYVSAQDALDTVASLPAVYSEPFGDSSQIPTLLVSKLASASVRVALSGDGGDEVFGGYNRYVSAKRLWQKTQWIPRPARAITGAAIRSIPQASWDSLFRVVGPLLPRALRASTPGAKAHKFAAVMGSRNGFEYYRTLTSHWEDPAKIVIGAVEPPTQFTVAKTFAADAQLENWMMAMDTQSYLPDDILVKVDRAAMAHGLETRVPYIDEAVLNLAWRMPLSMKIRGDESKWLLRQILNRHVPPELINRPKMGFGIPLGEWLRGPLRDWAENLLDRNRLETEGYFHADVVRKIWDDHQSKRHGWEHHLWTILMFQAWLDSRPRPVTPATSALVELH